YIDWINTEFVIELGTVENYYYVQKIWGYTRNGI
ncbi:hypothetical protein MQM_02871, partial [Staphylococcus aureus subsp. aureus VRS7]